MGIVNYMIDKLNHFKISYTIKTPFINVTLAPK